MSSSAGTASGGSSAARKDKMTLITGVKGDELHVTMAAVPSGGGRGGRRPRHTEPTDSRAMVAPTQQLSAA
jgi:hypothetical protein